MTALGHNETQVVLSVFSKPSLTADRIAEINILASVSAEQTSSLVNIVSKLADGRILTDLLV